MDLATQICSLMGVITLVQGMIPISLRRPFYTSLDKLWDWLFKTSHFSYAYIPENHPRRSYNSLYHEVELYLGSLHSSLSNKKLNIHRHDIDADLVFTLADGETLKDKFEGISMIWTHTCSSNDKSFAGENMKYGNGKSSSSSASSEGKRVFSLKMKKHRDRQALLTRYLEYVSNKAKAIDRLNSQRFLYTNDHMSWRKVPFQHPSTFRTLALPPPLKERIITDLQNFSTGEELYHHAGRAWKRGYLLYGPPGTGKSSLIAAIANFLHYDIYDIELTKVHSNSNLRSLLTSTTRKSLIVIEDIDCTLELSSRSKVGGKQEKIREEEEDSDSDGEMRGRKNGKRSNGVTLSGMLNFTDGLWSCCGEERIFVFTSNHKDRLDPALLRSGRMDFHILLSYCAFPAFKVLASNYLHISDHHPLLVEVENAMKSKPCVTPADIAEIMMRHQDDPDKAIESVIDALHRATITTYEQASNGLEQDLVEGNNGHHGSPKDLEELEDPPFASVNPLLKKKN